MNHDAGRGAFEALLARVCSHFGAPAQDRDLIVSTGELLIGNAPFFLQEEKWSGFIKVLVDVGKPNADDAPRLHRYLLTQQLCQPVPFCLAGAVHDETDHVMLHGYCPMPTDEASVLAFLAFLEGCRLVFEALRAQVPEGSISA